MAFLKGKAIGFTGENDLVEKVIGRLTTFQGTMELRKYSPLEERDQAMGWNIISRENWLLLT